VRAELVDEADLALAVAKGDESSPIEPHPHRRAVGLGDLGSEAAGSNTAASRWPIGVPCPTRVISSFSFVAAWNDSSLDRCGKNKPISARMGRGFGRPRPRPARPCPARLTRLPGRTSRQVSASWRRARRSASLTADRSGLRCASSRSAGAGNRPQELAERRSYPLAKPPARRNAPASER